jgi:hypothetical protein
VGDKHEAERPGRDRIDYKSEAPALSKHLLSKHPCPQFETFQLLASLVLVNGLPDRVYQSLIDCTVDIGFSQVTTLQKRHKVHRLFILLVKVGVIGAVSNDPPIRTIQNKEEGSQVLHPLKTLYV